MPGEVKRIQTRHGTVSVIDTMGDGFPIVFLHGSGFSKRVFKSQFEGRLRKRFRLVGIDLLGHGESEDAADPERAYTISGFAEAVADVLANLGISRTVVFGWSLGGHVGIELLGTTHLVAGLALAGCAPLGKGVIATLRGMHLSSEALLVKKSVLSSKNAQRLTAFCVGDAAAEHYVADMRRADERFRPILAKSLLSGPGVNQKRVVEAAEEPIAMINGSDDPVVRKTYIAGMRYKSLWGGVCHFVPDAGHAVFADQPQAFDAMLMDFTRSVAVAEARSAQQIRRSA